MKTPEEIMKIAVVDGRFPEGSPEELAIASDANCAYRYARVVLKGRFELGEEILATDFMYSYLYARDALKGTFELGEAIIATDPEYSYWYAKDMLKGRFPLCERVIINSDYECSYVKENSITNEELTELKMKYRIL